MFALLGLSNWVYKWYDPTGTWDAEAIAESFIALVEPGYRVSPAPSRQRLARRLGRIKREAVAARMLFARERPVARRGR